MTFGQYQAVVYNENLDGHVNLTTSGSTIQIDTDLSLSNGSIISIKTLPPLFA